MLLRFSSALVLGCVLIMPVSAQTVRFNTNVGNFDVVLNPNGMPELQGHVDNFLAYVEGGFYDNLLINRSPLTTRSPGGLPEGFVMQLGGFQINSIFQPSDSSGFNDNRDNRFAPVIVDADNDGTIDFDTSELMNTRGTVSLALSGTDSNSGTSEFFVNLGNNSRLDPEVGPGAADFVTFAIVPDLTTIDLIFQLDNQDLFADGDPFDDVRLLDNGTVVFVEEAFVLTAASAASASMQELSVPEPSALALAVAALVAICVMKPNKIR